jgi:hypothetical protein
MRWFTDWFRKPEPPTDVGSAESFQAVEDSRLILEVARDRWKRVDEAADRAAHANIQMRSQRDQNHFAEIFALHLHGRTKT